MTWIPAVLSAGRYCRNRCLVLAARAPYLARSNTCMGLCINAPSMRIRVLTEPIAIGGHHRQAVGFWAQTVSRPVSCNGAATRPRAREMARAANEFAICRAVAPTVAPNAFSTTSARLIATSIESAAIEW